MNRTMKLSNGYTVTDDGRIFTPKGKEAKQRHNRKGYRIITWPDKRFGRTTALVHRLVAQCFVDNPMPLLYTQINHIDGDKANNRAENLEWCDCWLNMQHRKAMRKALGLPWLTETEKVRQSLLFRSKRVSYRGCVYPSINSMARTFGVDKKTIRERIGRTWRGFPLEFATA